MREQRNYSSSSGTPIQYRTHAPRQTEESTRSRYIPRLPRETDDDNDDGWTVEKSHTSAIRYDTPRRSRETASLPDPKKTRVIRQRRADRDTLVIWFCLALIIMIIGWWLLSWVANWWQGVQDNMKYGTPRTFQADQYVNLGDSAAHPDHFIALNLHGVIEVLQINPLDSKKNEAYVLSKVDNDSVPATLSFRDVEGNGKIDVVVTIGDTTPFSIVMINDGKTLQPTQPAH